MSTSWQIALGLLLASLGILTADYFDLPYLTSLPSWLPGAAFIGAILSGSVLGVAIARTAIEMAAAPISLRRRLERQAKHVEGLGDISQPEQFLLAWAVANRTQVFSGDYFNEHVKALLARGYLSVPAGNHLTNKTPLRIPDYIWEALKNDLRDQDLSQLVGLRPFDSW